MNKPKIISKKVPSPGKRNIEVPRTETMKDADPNSPKTEDKLSKKKAGKPKKPELASYWDMYVGITSGDKCMLVFGTIA
jgi:hypothetical protein